MNSSQLLITKLEQQVLDEYSLIARNLDEVSPLFLPLFFATSFHSTRDSVSPQMSTVVQRLSSVQPHLLSELRPLERKLGLVFTLFKG